MKFNLTASFIHLPFLGVSYVALLVLLQDQRWKIQEEATCLKIKLYREILAFLLINSYKQTYQLVVKDRFKKGAQNIYLLFTYISHVYCLNPLHPNISLHILHTAPYTFPSVLKRRICLPIKRFLLF